MCDESNIIIKEIISLFCSSFAAPYCQKKTYVRKFGEFQFSFSFVQVSLNIFGIMESDGIEPERKKERNYSSFNVAGPTVKNSKRRKKRKLIFFGKENGHALSRCILRTFGRTEIHRCRITETIFNQNDENNDR